MSTESKIRGRRKLLVLATVMTLAMVGIVSFFLLNGGRGDDETQGVSGAQTTTSPHSVQPQSAPAVSKSEPTAIKIPKISAYSTLVPLGLNADNTVEVPPVSQPLQAGWYSYGPTPGEVGPAVILGHVDGNKNKGIFYRLKEMAPGDEVSITRKDDSTATFVVYRVDQVAKDIFPTDQVYGDTPGSELRLITCGGSFDHAAHSYRDNIVVYLSLKA